MKTEDKQVILQILNKIKNKGRLQYHELMALSHAIALIEKEIE